jgi:hypothetical protein
VLRRALLCAFALSALATAPAFAEGSFSVKFDPIALTVDANLEQQVAEIDGWIVYAGSGFAARPWSLDKLQPYTLVCREWDVLLAYAEVCAEVRATLVGDGSIIRLFVSGSW